LSASPQRSAGSKTSSASQTLTMCGSAARRSLAEHALGTAALLRVAGADNEVCDAGALPEPAEESAG
jgi:hypothetical protein